MTTDKQQIANRRNARNSTGPKTTKGKTKSSANALTYGIFSRGLMIDGEDPAEYAQLLQGLVDDLKPVGALEMIHVERIAMSVWRLRRLMRAESAAVGFRRDVQDTRKMLNDALGIPESVKFKDKHLEPLSEDGMKALASFLNIVEELTALAGKTLGEEDLKKQAPVYYGYLIQEAQAKGWAVYKYLMHRANLPEEKLPAAIRYCIDKDLPDFAAAARDYNLRLKVTMMREKFHEMKAVPPEAELYVRYQATLDNSLAKAIKGLREAQALRLSVIEEVTAEALDRN
jgi:hypothetical protein